MVDLNDLNIEYRHSPRRRRIGIMVTTAGKVVVTLPRGATQESLARALEKHRAWIEAKVAERQAATFFFFFFHIVYAGRVAGVGSAWPMGQLPLPPCWVSPC